MLPVFPRTQKAMRGLWWKRLFESVHGGDPVISGVPIRVQKEGKDSSFVNSSGERKTMEYKKIEVHSTYKPEEGRGWTLEEFLKKASEPGEKMAQEAGRRLLEEVAKVTNETGQVVDAKGQGFSPGLMLQAIEKMDISFDNRGEPNLPQMVVGPELYASIVDKIPIWEKDESFNSEMRGVIAKKREEFREREADRRLVD